jgi:diguanylate cyclase (GGDEF)-like protein/PAS domain S-box-containing protein
VKKIKKNEPSIFFGTFLSAVALLCVGLFLVDLFWHLSKEKRTLENRTRNGVQILQGIIATNPAFLFTAQMEKGALVPSALLSGWSAQIRSVLESLPRQTFPWSPSDLRTIVRLGRTFGRFFRERPPTPEESRQSSPVATIREILTIRQALAQKVVLILGSLSRESRNLDRTLGRIEAGIFGVGLAAFGLFSFSVLTHRNTRNALKKLSESESFLRALIEVLPTAIFLKDTDGHWLMANRAGLDLFDLSGKIWQNHTDLELSREYPVYRETLETCRVRDLEAWKLGKRTVAVESVPGKDGAILQLETTRFPLFNPEGLPSSLVVSTYDLTERMSFEELLQRYQRVFESTTEGVVITDLIPKIIDVNPAFSLITGYSREEVLGRDPRFLNSGRQTEEFYQTMEKAIRTQGGWKGELWNRKKSGEIYCESLLINCLVQNEKMTHYVGLFSDFTESKENEERIIHLAFHDTLTDLPNRRAFNERLKEAIDRLGRIPGRIAVGLLDLDGFKEVNDRLGHPAGDDLLVQVSKRLGGALRRTDTLARLGGDEFGLILPDIKDEGAFFDRVMKILREPFEIEGERVTISGSLGITVIPPDMPDADLLLEHADLALYRVKNSGRNGWTHF